MTDKTIVALDAMGGDNAPMEIVKGAVEAVNTSEAIIVHLFGDETQIRRELAKYSYPQDQVRITHTTEVISVEESPAVAIKKNQEE